MRVFVCVCVCVCMWEKLYNILGNPRLRNFEALL